MLDKANQIIMENLLNNCRVSNRELAKITKLTEPAILKRIKKLEQEYILKYDGIINWGRIKLIKMFYLANLPNPEEIKKQKPLLGFFETSGFYKNAFACFFKTKKQKREFESLLPRSRVSLETFSFHQKTISLFDIQHKTIIKEKERDYKHTNKNENLTKKDIKILNCVCNGGGRSSLWEIAKKAGLTYEIVRYRFKRLERLEYFSLFIAQPDPKKFGLNTIYLYLQFKKKVPVEKLSRVKQSVGYILCSNNRVLLPIFTKSFEDYIEETSIILKDLRTELKHVDFYPIKEAQILNRYPFEYLLKT